MWREHRKWEMHSGRERMTLTDQSKQIQIGLAAYFMTLCNHCFVKFHINQNLVDFEHFTIHSIHGSSDNARIFHNRMYRSFLLFAVTSATKILSKFLQKSRSEMIDLMEEIQTYPVKSCEKRKYLSLELHIKAYFQSRKC